MSIYETARSLGEEILLTLEAKNYLRAREKFESDDVAKSLITEYTRYESEFRDLFQNEKYSKEAFDEISKKYNDAKNNATQNETIMNFINAQEELENLLQRVYTITRCTVTGEEPNLSNSGCTSDCSTCGGCH